ncbi:MAG: complex I subunit 1 family protein [Candidatus Fermentibacteraceae bacterium]
MIEAYYLIALGFGATAALGLAASWIDRKVTARLQYRVGPPLLQPLTDLVKLMGKETTVPSTATRPVFFAAPLTGLSAVMVASAVVWAANANAQSGFVGDWIVLIYLLVMPSLAMIAAGFASGNPVASLGASREMKLVLSYELPFVLALLVPVIHHPDNAIRLGALVEMQRASGAVAGSLSGLLALLVVILVTQAKLALVPFDIPEAETELAEGPLIEYSGPLLGTFRLMRNMMLFLLPFVAVTLYWGGASLSGWGFLWAFLKVVALVAVTTVIRNTNPRVRIDQAMRFFWGPVTVLAAASVVLALAGA